MIKTQIDDRVRGLLSSDESRREMEKRLRVEIEKAVRAELAGQKIELSVPKDSVHVHVPPARAPEIYVAAAKVTIPTPAAPVVHVEATKPPAINVSPTPVTIQPAQNTINIPAGAITVNVQVVLPARRATVTRDSVNGEITSVLIQDQ